VSRIERLINLTAALLATDRALTSEELSERVPGYPEDRLAFRRQFERDKDALRELGMPLVLIHLATNGAEMAAYRIDRDRYYVKDPGLTPSELSALTLAARLVRLDAGSRIGGDGADGAPNAMSAMWKLRSDRVEQALAGTSSAEDRRVTTDVELPTDAALGTIFEAIAAGRSLNFTYRDEARHVVPRALSFEKGRWYLAAYDTKRADDRSFRIDRMDADVHLGNVVADPMAASRETKAPRSMQRPWELGEDEPVVATVLVDASQAPWATRSVAPTDVATNEDGSVVLTLRVRNPSSFRSFVLGFLDSAEILSPDTFRSDMIEWLSSLASQRVPDFARDRAPIRDAN
jgi:proteasome accessory factor B